jgi:hypothetical protein
VVEEAEHRTWYKLIGRDHDVQAWDPDGRTDIQVTTTTTMMMMMMMMVR